MVNRNHLGKTEPVAHPSARVVTDFARLITDIDQLMVDVGSTTTLNGCARKPNGQARRPSLKGTISSLREHAQTFAKSLRQFECLLDHVPIPFMELDGHARILRTNEECAHMLNGSGTALPGKSLFSFIDGSDNKRLKELLETARHTRKLCTARLSILRNGKSYPVELRIRRQTFSTSEGYVAVVEGAADLRKTNGHANGKITHDSTLIQQLVASLSREAHLATMADIVRDFCRKAFGSPAGMIFAEKDGALQIISHWRTGSIATELIDEMKNTGPVARAFRTGEPALWRQHRTSHSKVARFLHGLLRRCHCRHIAFVPFGGSDRSVGVLAIVLPHTDRLTASIYDDLLRLRQAVSGCIVRAHAFDEALSARVKAENAVQSKDEFLSVLSHELKNPMMPILGWAVALSSGTLPEEKQNLALEGIVRNVRSLNYLIEDLFDAARIASGKLRLQFSELRIQEVAREALISIQSAAEGKRLRISTDISEAIPPFVADPRRLQQVLVNLLNNAVKFTPAGGAIALQVRKHGEAVECIVSDTGKGIEREFLPFVFERFRQEKRYTKARAAGLGLGLAIVREIVELHGGSIEACSEGMDKGATFTLRLPMRRKHSRSAPRPSRKTELRPARSRG